VDVITFGWLILCGTLVWLTLALLTLLEKRR
jgi:hypothetical protein